MTIIRVLSLAGEELKRFEDDGIFHFITLKYVKSWEYVDPKSVMKRKSISKDDFLYFFELPFTSNEFSDHIPDIRTSLGIYTVSSPIEGMDQKGGINTTIEVGKREKAWDLSRLVLDCIPKEFLKQNSRYYYEMNEEYKKPQSKESKEINLAIKNTKRMAAHIPINLYEIDLMSYPTIQDDYDFYLPFVKAYQLDSLLFKPKIPDYLIPVLNEKVISMQQQIASTKYLGYKQDIGQAYPKICTALARMSFDEEITRKHINEAEETWGDAFHHSVKMDEHFGHIDKNRTTVMTSKASQLYRSLVAEYGVNVPISVNEIKAKHPKEDIDLLVSVILRAGAAYSPKNGTIILLETYYK